VGEVLERRGRAMVRDLLRRRDAILAGGERVAPGAVVEVAVWQDRRGRRLARVERVLATPGSARARLYRALAAQGLGPLHSREVEEEARRWAEAPLDVAGLVDLTALPFVTIDNESSRDLDQALYIERGAGGDGYAVWYALADASFFVRPNSALFREALRRGASYYLPGLTAPMLPRSLSEGIISLNEGEPRRALTLRMNLDAGGHRRGTDVLRAVIRSRAKLTYDGVQAFHDAPATSPIAGAEYEASLRLLREVGEWRIAVARARDVVAYHRAEVEVGVDPDRGEVFTVRVSPRNDVERWNEQLSLLCNTEGARILDEVRGAAHVQPVYRVHPTPTPAALASLRRSIDALVTAQGLDPGVWRWCPDGGERDGGGAESLTEYLARLASVARDDRSRRLLAAVEGLAMRTSEAASFSTEPGPHHGVGAAGYSRISAPMREVVGIFTHKELFERLGDPRDACDDAADEALRREVIEAGNRSRSIQRQLVKEAERLVIEQIFEHDLALERDLRPWRRGTIVSVRPTRLYVALDEPPIEVKVYCGPGGSIPSAAVALDEAEVALRDPDGGRGHVLGDAVGLRVAAGDRGTGRWSFELRRE
jgi:ribonuclease R